MAEVVVIGGGVAGMAVAARSAKLGHAVTLYERSDRLGGRIRRLESDGFGWDLGPASFTLPAAPRDLFAKSGRRLERVLELEPVTSPRRHVLGEGDVLDLPLTDRGGQRDVLAGRFGPKVADAWTRLVDDGTSWWEMIRRHAVEGAYPGWRGLDRRTRRALSPLRSLTGLLTRRLRDRDARRVFAATALGPGADPRRAPAYLAVAAYVERTFGRWTCAGGPSRIVTALGDRLAERGVRVELGTEVTWIEVDGGTATGVRLAGDRQHRADVVIAAVPAAPLLADPPARLRRVARLRHTPGFRFVGLGWADPVDLPFETVLHARSPGGATVIRASDRTATVLTPRSLTPRGRSADHTAETAGSDGPTGWESLIGVGPELAEPTARVDAVIAPTPPAWADRWMFSRLAPNRTDVSGLYCVGPTARPGPDLPYLLLGAALVAGDLGPPVRRSAR